MISKRHSNLSAFQGMSHILESLSFQKNVGFTGCFVKPASAGAARAHHGPVGWLIP